MARSLSTPHSDDDSPIATDEFIVTLLDNLRKTMRCKTVLARENEQLTAENTGLRELLGDVGERIEVKKAQYIAKMEAAKGRECELEEAQTQIRDSKQRIEELEAECSKLRKEKDEAEIELQKAQDYESLGALDVEHQLHDSNLEVLDLQRELGTLRMQLSDSQRETDDLKSQVEISGGQLQGLQIEVDALKATLHDSKLESESVIRSKENIIAQLQQMLSQQPSGPSGTAFPSQQIQPTQTARMTIVIPPRPSVPFEDSFRISVTPSRKDSFKESALFIDQCHALPEDSTFTRGYLMDKLGGAGQGVVARVANKKSLSTVHDVGLGVLYPQPNLNSWLPAMPGAHGYMFVGLKGPGKDHERFLEPTKWSLFLPKSGKSWEYYGEYEVHRQPDLDLTVEEWEAFSPEFKRGYAECTAKKGNPHLDVTPAIIEDYQTQYDKGLLRIPCTALKCVGYNRQLVLDLVAPPPNLPSSVKKSGTETPQGTPAPKRKKTTDTPQSTPASKRPRTTRASGSK